MAPAQLQRWALFLGAHTYTIAFKGSEHHGNANGLSRLPLELLHPRDLAEPVDMFQMAQVDSLPVTCSEIQ